MEGNIGVAGMVYTGITIGGSGGLALPIAGFAFTESLIMTGYGIIEIISGFQGNRIPSYLDLQLEIRSLGFAKTGFDKIKNPDSGLVRQLG